MADYAQLYAEQVDRDAAKTTQNKKKSGSSSGLSGLADPSSFKRGGKVRKTGRALVHKGERVLTKAQTRKYDRGKR